MRNGRRTHRSAAVEFRNDTTLDSARLRAMFLRHTAPYRHDGLRVHVRWSRGAPFSGTCFHGEGRIYVNLGRHVRYPFTFVTHVARARSAGRCWWRESYTLTVADAYQLALFVYLHELYHYLVRAAGRSPCRKEAMCDRFAARVLVESYGCRVRDRRGRDVPLSRWYLRDLHAFVAAAPRQPPAVRPAARRDIPVRIAGLPGDRSA